ncbi:solute carrier family 2 member 9, like 1 [Anabas testudineus]|uniref:Solute carrier family 2, facilitated glucose transporter member 5 n=1 Tax=Anabas testudineus TaxID=64144 RepID=A0A3Q1J7V1_ANATE|nr:solute carrier family 2 member 9, like 1 [Anabas testudineus]
MENFLQQLTQGHALVFIIILGIGGSFQTGYQVTGLNSPSPYVKSFINSSWYDRYKEPPSPQMVTMIWSLMISLFAVAGLCGALSVKLFSGLGRKKTMICNSFISIVAGGIMLASRWAKSYEIVIVARILYGFSAGVGLSSHLIYLGESSPRKIRGRVTLTVATFLSLGKLSGQFFGLTEIFGSEELWNISLCVPAFLSVVQVIVLPFLPEAPRYLFIEKGDDTACREALQSLWGKGDYKQEMDEMLTEQVAIEAAPPKSPMQLLGDRTIRWQLITMSLIYCFNLLSGMPVISVFSYDIFLQAGIPRDNIGYIIVGLGLFEITSSMVSGLMVDLAGRRPLMWVGYGMLTVICVLVTVTLNLKDSGSWVPYVTAGLIVLFIISFCGGPAGATATLNSEIFIQSNRMAAFVLTGMFRWFTFAFLGMSFPFLISSLTSFCFLLFAFVCLVGSLYTFFILPETKGKTMLEITEEFKTITLCQKSFLGENSGD